MSITRLIGSLEITNLDKKLIITDSSLPLYVEETFILNNLKNGIYHVGVELLDEDSFISKLYLLHSSVFSQLSMELLTRTCIFPIWTNLEILNEECIVAKLSKFSTVPHCLDSIYCDKDCVLLRVNNGKVLIKVDNLKQPKKVIVQFPNFD